MATVPVRFICLTSCFSNFVEPMARRSPRKLSWINEVTVNSKFVSAYSRTLQSSSRVCLRISCNASSLSDVCISCLRVSLPCSFALRFLYITWLRIRMNAARAMRAMIEIFPPKCSTRATKKQIVKAAPAVINQPPMTLSTPVIR